MLSLGWLVVIALTLKLQAVNMLNLELNFHRKLCLFI
jgi:hypothetical protein